MPPAIINVLLVEDKPGFARLVRETLSEAAHSQFRLIHAEGIEKGKQCIEKERPDVILLDLSLPESQGLPSLHKILPCAKDVPVIVLTGFEDDSLAMQALQGGAQDYLIKKTEDLNRLGSAIRFAIERQKVLEHVKQGRQMEHEERESAMAGQRSLVGWEDGSVTAQMAGVGPLRERAEVVFRGFLQEYTSLLVVYIEALALDKTLPRREIIDLANRLGDQAGAPRDVVEIHLSAVAAKSKGKGQAVVKTFTVEGRLMLLEIMGHLVDYYRGRRNEE